MHSFPRPHSLSGRVLLDGELVDGVTLSLEDGVIVGVERGEGDSGVIIAPGFIDVHVHGAAGHDFMDADEAATRAICVEHACSGTTSLMATTLTAAPDDLLAAVEVARRVAEAPGPGEARIVGVHLEGPWINPERAGAQDPDSIRVADPDELGRLLRRLGESLVAQCTIAPEIDGAMELIDEFADRVIFSIGHTSATAAQAQAALRAGARHFTHLFNAMTGLHHREPGVVGAALADAHATAELIADGLHIDPTVLAIAARCLGDRGVLVTDAMRACGLGDGSYSLYRHEVTVAEGAARLADGTLAGSVLTMDAAVRTMVEHAHLTLAQALTMASTVPARLLGLESTHGRIEPGRRADLVVLDEQLEVACVLIAGDAIPGPEEPWISTATPSRPTPPAAA